MGFPPFRGLRLLAGSQPTGASDLVSTSGQFSNNRLITKFSSTLSLPAIRVASEVGLPQRTGVDNSWREPVERVRQGVYPTLSGSGECACLWRDKQRSQLPRALPQGRFRQAP